MLELQRRYFSPQYRCTFQNQNTYVTSFLQFTSDDIVAVKKDTTKQLFWKLAVVDNLITSADGNVRAANVRVSEPSGINTKLF